MTKTEAKCNLGGTMRSVAEACGLTLNAVKKWPQHLTPKQTDTVQAALFRKLSQNGMSAAGRRKKSLQN